jgi:DNA polymerase
MYSKNTEKEMEKIKTLSLDLETYSDVDLKKAGVYPYAESPNFEILLFAYSINNSAVEVVDITCGEEVPVEILAALTDDSVEKWAYNAQFERVCLSYWLKQNYPQYFVSYSIPDDSAGSVHGYGVRIWGCHFRSKISVWC